MLEEFILISCVNKSPFLDCRDAPRVFSCASCTNSHVSAHSRRTHASARSSVIQSSPCVSHLSFNCTELSTHKPLAFTLRCCPVFCSRMQSNRFSWSLIYFIWIHYLHVITLFYYFVIYTIAYLIFYLVLFSINPL